MPAEDEAVTATVRISAEVVTSTADIAKYILQILLGVRGQGQATDGVLWRMGGNSMKLASKVTATLYDVATRNVDGIGTSGQIGWKNAMSFNDMTTFSISAELADPENLASLRKELRKAGVTFALTKIGQGDTLIGYHVSQGDVVNSVVTPLLRVWASAAHVDPDSDRELAQALVSHDVARDATEAEQIVQMARSEEQMPSQRPATEEQMSALQNLVDKGLANETTVESIGTSPTAAEASAVLEAHQGIAEKETGPVGNRTLQLHRGWKGVKERTEELRAQGPLALYGAASDDAARSARPEAAKEPDVAVTQSRPTQGRKH